MIPISTAKVLRAWAQWGEGQSIDYPSLSPMFGNRALKTPLYGAHHAAPEILEMEAAVCRLVFEDRDIIIQRWQRKSTFRQIGLRLGISRWSVRRRLQLAESEVHRLFEGASCQNAPTMLPL